MSNFRWVDKHIEIEPPRRPKKLTGTRFASVLGLNPWSTPFEIWCAVTRTYEKPFEDTIYTIAGKTIEPKQMDYMKRAYVMDNLCTPTDLYGADYFNKTRGDFFNDKRVFGGMWDALLMNAEGRPETVLEFKTSKRSEDWAAGVPEYYALQAALYAYLLGVDDVIMVASFLEAKDYDAPERYVPSAENTITAEFSVSGRYPDFDSMLALAMDWWKAHVESGISPDYDEKRDREILSALRTSNPSPDADMEELIAEAERLKAEVDGAAAAVADKEKRLKTLMDAIRDYAVKSFGEGDKKVEMKGSVYTFTCSRVDTVSIDKAALEADGLLPKYSKTGIQYRMSVK